jgi:MobA/MobL family
MASFHIQINTGEKGDAAEHAQYIAREGRFTEERYGEVAARGHANFPEWAREDHGAFWRASDAFERANGNSYREYELALPRELSRAEQVALVQRFAEQELGVTRVYQWAIHTPTASDGKEQPHVHLMFSDRQLDGIERGPEQFFKRYNSKNPERGGSRKATYGANKEEAALVYEGIRERWANVQNQALEHAGAEARVDHRSLAAQGIRDREPELHRGPAVSGIEARGEVSQVGERQREQRQERALERAAVVAEVRVVTREEMSAERVAVRERRELAQEATGEDRAAVLKCVEADRREQLGRAQAAAERRVERRQGLGIGGQLKEKLLTQARALRERIGQQLGRVKEWIAERFPDPMQQLKARSRAVLGAMAGKGRGAQTHKPGAQAEKTLTSRRERDVEQSAEPTPGRSPAAARERVPREEAVTQRERLASLNAGELQELITRINPPSVGRLVELEPAVVAARTQAEGYQRTAHQALLTASRAADESHAWRHAHGMQAKLHDLGVVKAAYLVEREAAGSDAEQARTQALTASRAALEELAHARREADQRITQETAPARVQVAELRQLMTAAYEREGLVKEFERLARDRAAGRAEYQDTGQDWQGTPPKLRQAIDAYNRELPQVQAQILERFSRTPALVKSLGEDLKLRRAHVREQERDQGWDLGR